MNNENSRTDILYVITKSNWGGAQKYVYELACAAREKFRVAVALGLPAAGTAQAGGHGALAQKLEAAQIPIFEIAAFQRDISFGKEVRVFVELFKLFRRVRPMIVHLNSSKAGGLGALAAQIAGVPRVVFTSHGLPFEEDRVGWQKFLIMFLTWLTFSLCDKVIIITGANLTKAQKMPLLGRRLELIRIGLASVQKASREEARKKLMESCAMPRASHDATWIGTIAEYHPNKGLSYLVRGIELLRAKCPDITVVLIGSGELEEALRAEIRALGLHEVVFLAGFIDNAATYLHAFDIFTLTSIKEGLPYTVLEAGSAGLPFVGSSIGGIQEVVTDMVSGILVRPKQPKEIAGALELLITDPARGKLYGAALKERVGADFSEASMLEKTLSLYESIPSGAHSTDDKGNATMSA